VQEEIDDRVHYLVVDVGVALSRRRDVEAESASTATSQNRSW